MTKLVSGAPELTETLAELTTHVSMWMVGRDKEYVLRFVAVMSKDRKCAKQLTASGIDKIVSERLSQGELLMDSVTQNLLWIAENLARSNEITATRFVKKERLHEQLLGQVRT